MKIRDLHIDNLGSVRQVSFENFADLTVLVGKNGTGKSFVFTALRLLFEEFATAGGDSKWKDEDYLWHRRNTSNNIGIEASIELAESEFANLAEESNRSEGDIEADLAKGPLLLRVKRELVFGEGWKTLFLELGSAVLVKDNEVSSDLPAQPPADLADVSAWTLYLFDPRASQGSISGPRLLVKDGEPKAFHSNPDLDALVESHRLAVSEETKGQSYEEWPGQQGLEIVPRTPNKTEAGSLHKALAENNAEPEARPPAAGFADLIRTSFQMISVARDSRESDDLRAPLLDKSDTDEITKLSVSTNAEDDAKWGAFGADVEASLSKRLEPNPEQFLVADKGLRLPLPYIGGGEQALIGLEWALKSRHRIYGIEEPENHLHPQLSRRIFSHLKSHSPTAQVIMSTHSHFLVDKSDPTANWRFRMEGRETKAERCSDESDLRSILTDLGIVPSDMLYKDVVVFVEGGTEKLAVFPIWASKLGIEIGGASNVGLVNVGGDTRLKDNLRIWLEVAPNAPAEYLVVLDSHSSHLISEIHEELGIPVDRFVPLKKHGIEDYYPPKFIAEAYNALFELQIDSTEFHIREGESRTKKMQEILEREKRIEGGWKVTVGQFVASRMRASEIDDEIRGVLGQIDQLKP